MPFLTPNTRFSAAIYTVLPAQADMHMHKDRAFAKISGNVFTPYRAAV
ncbi:hypothetical protein HMPREF0663_10240 [Hoylesella oralis ATCC 33269]|uniref:Uncharacterized protein n=1 Tax=Hoylesella oralis ATCC 33269 TaxID=873533 RepID=E7RM90_9BACT|nr:hypothetical protein HMPREF0663_10240 [Hoylesella oralis ATCC 33269]